MCRALEHLPLAVLAMRDVLVQLGAGVHHDRSMSRIDRARVQLLHAMERAQVLHQIAVGRVDEAGTAPDDGVAREQRALRRHEERDVVGRVPGRVLRHDVRALGRGEPLAVAQMFGARQPERVQRSTDAFRERRRARRVILMVVRHEYRGDGSGRSRDLVQVRGVVGTGIDRRSTARRRRSTCSFLPACTRWGSARGHATIRSIVSPARTSRAACARRRRRWARASRSGAPAGRPPTRTSARCVQREERGPVELPRPAS